MSNQSATGSDSCPEPMGWTELRTLRNTSQLEPGCTYAIDDYDFGCLEAGTTVYIKALSENELSQSADVNTLFDNTAWRGSYDLDLNRLTELHDNRGNHVYDRLGVLEFPWGDTGWTNVTWEEGADVFIDSCNTVYTVLETTFRSSARVDLRGLVGGYLRYSEFRSGCDVRFDNCADVRVNNTEYHSGARDYISGFQGIAYRLDSSFGEASFNQILATSNITEQRFDNCRLGSAAYVRAEAGSGGVWRLYDQEVANRAEIRKYGTSNWTLYRNALQSYGRLRGRGNGTERTYYASLGEISILDQTGGNQYYSTLQSYGRLYSLGGTDQRITVMNGGRLNTGTFNNLACTHDGSYTTTLTANNTNKRRDQTPFNNFV